MFKVEGLSALIGGTRILRDISLIVHGGEMCGLIGRNGAGKTTFMRSVMGFLQAEGRVELGHVNLMELEGYERPHHGLGYMPEDRRLFPEFTVEENILLPVWSMGIEDARGRLGWIYELMPEIKKHRERRALALSGGQQKMVALGRALMAGTRLLLLDEPFEGLAPALTRRIGEVLYNLKDEGVSILLAESNETHVHDLLERVYGIERGSVIEH